MPAAALAKAAEWVAGSSPVSRLPTYSTSTGPRMNAAIAAVSDSQRTTAYQAMLSGRAEYSTIERCCRSRENSTGA